MAASPIADSLLPINAFGAERSNSTSRPRFSCAAGLSSPTRKARLSSGRRPVTVPTGNPAGNRPPNPELTITSPTFTSVFNGTSDSSR